MQNALQGLLNEWRKVKGTLPENTPGETPVGLHVRLTLADLRELERSAAGEAPHPPIPVLRESTELADAREAAVSAAASAAAAAAQVLVTPPVEDRDAIGD